MVDKDKDKCLTCDGCGKVANDDDKTPWSEWMKLPERVKLAVYMGLVHPMICVDCNGTGLKSYCEHEEKTENDE